MAVNDDLRRLAETDVTTPIPREALYAALSQPPFVQVPGTFNTRDVGAAGALRPGFAFRSGALDGLTAEGREALARGLGVQRIFDLRSQREHAGAPDPDVPGVTGVWLATDEADAVVDLAGFVDGDGERGYAHMYLAVLELYGPTIKAVLEHVRDRPDEPFLFHCTAGRDRTGVVAGLLLSLAGAEPDAVALDFLLSRIGTEAAREQLLAFARHGAGVQSDDTPGFRNLCSLKATCWDAFLAAVAREHGGFDGYVLNTLAFSDVDLATIKHNLKSAPPPR